ncbi:hypothetical protein PF005_g18563 [Phytophthora fragariae]|uniref:Uncharacterized protein n=1 Tax=Phytophthora fragariae TaxID=53985 RepID=A0A6A3S756_9STRA|nr:hypothetical protein PF003_g2916 [Phytophthora fragariae]KAE8937496.1 hypothetical protein PF009_g12603 [Phytophthora fragariae]KAE8992725.1 hypothetical protein PF011_g17442 [Phytophthora fragariae]KAE9091937.1 hypothetical protein PF010_g17994 [Phytophthora fragariae]KAE9111233.1 hypothetical protein PF007_g11555 [Phytophthora fragariae]
MRSLYLLISVGARSRSVSTTAKAPPSSRASIRRELRQSVPLVQRVQQQIVLRDPEYVGCEC